MIKTMGLSYKDILSDINLCLNNACIVALLGPNGAGKSTLLKLCSGVLTPSNGSLEISQEKMSYVSQGLFFTSGLTVKNLIEAYWYKKKRILNQKLLEDVREVFSFFECDQFLSRQLEHLSGGELQKVILACAISTQPEVLLLDEPVSGLDPYQYEFVLLKIKEWQKKSKSLVLHVSHDINRSLLFSDEIIALKKGKIQFHKNKRDILVENFESLFNIELQKTNKEGEILQVISKRSSELL